MLINIKLSAKTIDVSSFHANPVLNYSDKWLKAFYKLWIFLNLFLLNIISESPLLDLKLMNYSCFLSAYWNCRLDYCVKKTSTYSDFIAANVC